MNRFFGYFALVVMLLLLPVVPSKATMEEIQLLEVRGAWMRQNMMADRPSAIYLDIENFLDQELKLVEVTSDAAERIMMHEVTRFENRVEMIGLAYVLVAGMAVTSFAPGERHLMVFDLDPTVKVGDEIAITLHFDDNSFTNARVKVCSLVATGMC